MLDFRKLGIGRERVVVAVVGWGTLMFVRFLWRRRSRLDFVVLGPILLQIQIVDD